jgi:hypothetical protein
VRPRKGGCHDQRGPQEFNAGSSDVGGSLDGYTIQAGALFHDWPDGAFFNLHIGQSRLPAIFISLDFLDSAGF